MMLFEQVLSIGLVGIVILFAGLAMAQSIRAYRGSSLAFEAQNIAEDTLESYQARGVELLNLGDAPVVDGAFSDSTAYQINTNIYALPDSGPSAGLTEEDIKGVAVSVSWSDRSGQHVVKTEGFVVRLQR